MKLIRLGKSGFSAICDDDDFEFLSGFKWYLLRGPRINYAQGLSSDWRKKQRMHKLIMQPSQRMVIDHINFNGLDNRRENLRICTNRQNVQNQRVLRGGSSKYKGVQWDKVNRKWRASIVVNSRFVNLGRYHDEIKAADIYDEAAKKYFGEFAYTNFLNGKLNVTSN